jgi:hypothetical protein
MSMNVHVVIQEWNIAINALKMDQPALNAKQVLIENWIHLKQDVFVVFFIIKMQITIVNYAMMFRSAKFALILILVKFATMSIIGLLLIKIHVLAWQDIMIMLDNNVFIVE